MSPTRTVLITGAAGRIGRFLREGLHGRYELRLLDVVPQEPARRGEQLVQVDLLDRDRADAALSGCDAVVHLAAIPREAPFDDIVRANVETTYSVFEGARRAGVRRVVFASSNHATGFYGRDELVTPSTPVRPDSYYGVSKVFGEALGRLYADKHGLEVVCLRLGAFKERPLDERDLAMWLSPPDCLELVVASLEASVGFLVAYGISANTRRWYADDGWAALGYRPSDDAERFAADVERRTRPSFDRQGGEFTRTP